MNMQGQLDECEKLVGSWNPNNKISNLYETMDQIYDEIDEFNAQNEDSKIQPTPTAGQVAQTPGGSRRNTMSNMAKQFNTDLHNLQTKFSAMEDIAYDEQKIRLVFQMTEKALE